MIERIISLSLALLMCLALTACGQSAVEPTETPGAESEGVIIATEAPAASESPATEPESEGSRVLVAYFSRVGVTPFDDNIDATSSASVNIRDGELVGNMQYLAEYIAEATGGDIHQIITEKQYPSDYRDTTDLAAEEQAADERPALSSQVENMEQYDIIFLGYPNWWGTLPQAVMSFLDSYDFSGKTIIPFCSHGGSRLGRGPGDIEALCPDATLLEGLAVSGSNVANAQSDVQSWIAGLGLEF